MLCINSIVSFKGNKNVVMGAEFNINGEVESYIVEDRFTGEVNTVAEEEVIPWNRVKHQIKKTFNSK